MSSFDVERIRGDFPYATLHAYGRPLVYLDSAATAQKPRVVIDAVNRYNEAAGNVNRGTHFLSEHATAHYIQAREAVARFINANHASEIVFTRGTTEAINLVAHCLSQIHFQEGDEIILTEMEHHSNIVPWYLVAKRHKLVLKVAPIEDDGSLNLQAFRALFSARTKLAAFSHASNALGTINPIEEMISIAKSYGALTLVDGAQAAPHIPVDVSALGVDFYCFSGRKIYGPTGIGVLYGKAEWLDRFPPYQGGGDMIKTVAFDHITFSDAPEKFEAGTPNISGAIGLAAALGYLNNVGHAAIRQHETSLYEYAHERMKSVSGATIIGTAAKKVSLLSFVLDGVHPHDISSVLDREGVSIRAGHLCAQPLLRRLGISALSRASFALYTTKSEIDAFISALGRVYEVFRR